MATRTIAFSGKGGSGKTTLAALLLRRLLRGSCRPVLAVDADPNATLAEALGVEIEGFIADLRDQMGQEAQKVTEIPKQRLLEQMLQQCLTEADGFDLLALGRPEGPKCYCYVNAMLRRYLQELRGAYAAVVIDCEAGMEYLSRLTVDDVDTLVLVAEATPVGLRSARRISELADSLPIRVGQRILAVNKVHPDLPLDEQALPEGLTEAVVQVPFSQQLLRCSARGEPIDDSAAPAVAGAVEEIARLFLAGSPNAASV